MRIAFIGDSLTEGFPGCSYLAVLRQRRAADDLINLGRGNDTVLSLLRRLERTRLAPVDQAVIWVGVNDVEGIETWSNRLAQGLIRRPRTAGPDAFGAIYDRVVRWALERAPRVIAVAPMLKGERIDSAPNRQLDRLSEVIHGMTDRYPQVEFLDMRAVFTNALAGQPASGYLSPSAFATLRDLILYRTPAQIDAAA